MRHRNLIFIGLFFALIFQLQLAACGSSGDSSHGLPRLLIQPDDGRGPILRAIAAATNNIRLTIYQITDLKSVLQTPAAPADGV